MAINDLQHLQIEPPPYPARNGRRRFWCILNEMKLRVLILVNSWGEPLAVLWDLVH